MKRPFPDFGTDGPLEGRHSAFPSADRRRLLALGVDGPLEGRHSAFPGADMRLWGECNSNA